MHLSFYIWILEKTLTVKNEKYKKLVHKNMQQLLEMSLF